MDINIHCLLFGENHRDERASFMEFLLHLNALDPVKHPQSRCFDTWEEAKYRWWIDLDRGLDDAQALMGVEHPTRGQLEQFLLAPDGPVTDHGRARKFHSFFPKTFAFDHPDSYYQKE